MANNTKRGGWIYWKIRWSFWKKAGSENENQQELVPVEIESDNSEDENDGVNITIRAHAISANFSIPMRAILGSLIKSSNSLRINQDE